MRSRWSPGGASMRATRRRASTRSAIARSSASCGSIASGSQPASRSSAAYASALRASATHATRRGGAAQLGGEGVEVGGDVGDRDAPARPYDARHLRDRPRLVGERAQRALRQRDVEARVRERKRLGVAEQEARARAGGRRAACLLDRAGAEVDADGDAPQLAREQERGGAAAARDVDDARAGRDAGEPSEPQREPLAARVQLVVEQPARGVALVQPGAAALGVGLEFAERDAGDHALALAARSARTCAR